MTPRQMPDHPRSYQVDAARYKVTSQRNLGLHPIPVNRIVGSAGKADQLSADFKPIIGGWSTRRFQGLVRVMKEGTQLQPIKVYKLHDLYYVVDGHNRVAAAKELGQVWIDAYVTEALPKAEGDENLLYYERKRFEEQTGLTRIYFSQLGRYPRLIVWVQAYTATASVQLDRTLTLVEGAALWYREVYRPTARRITQTGMKKGFPRLLIGDIFFLVWERQIELSRGPGKALTFYEAFFELERENPGPITRRVVRRGLGAVTAPLPLPPKPPEPEDDPAVDLVDAPA